MHSSPLRSSLCLQDDDLDVGGGADAAQDQRGGPGVLHQQVVGALVGFLILATIAVLAYRRKLTEERAAIALVAGLLIFLMSLSGALQHLLGDLLGSQNVPATILAMGVSSWGPSAWIWPCRTRASRIGRRTLVRKWRFSSGGSRNWKRRATRSNGKSRVPRALGGSGPKDDVFGPNFDRLPGARSTAGASRDFILWRRPGHISGPVLAVGFGFRIEGLGAVGRCSGGLGGGAGPVVVEGWRPGRSGTAAPSRDLPYRPMGWNHTSSNERLWTSSLRRTLPAAPLGSASRKCTPRGTL